MRARRSPRKGRRAWGLAAWFSSQPHPYVLPPAALGRTVQGKAQPGSGSGSLEVLSKGSLLGPAVPAGCVGSWVKDTAGTGSREGRAPWCRGEFQSELPGWCCLVAQWAADSPTGQYSSLDLEYVVFVSPCAWNPTGPEG